MNSVDKILITRIGAAAAAGGLNSERVPYVAQTWIVMRCMLLFTSTIVEYFNVLS